MDDRHPMERGLPALLCVGAIVCALAAPSLAAADTFCVQPEASCAPANTHATVQGALDAANGNGAGVRDAILLGATIYTENVSAAGGNPVDVVGKGTAQTTITSPGGFGTTTFALGDGFSTVSALTIQIPGGGNNTGLALVGDASGIAVTEQGGDFGHVGVDLQNSGASLNGSTVTMTAGTAAQSFSGGTVRDSRLSGSGGFGGIGTVRRSRISAVNSAVSLQGGSTIENTLLRPLGGSGSFVGVSAFSGSSSFSVDLRNVTIAGEGVAGTMGVSLNSQQSFGPAPALSAAVTNTIIRGMDTDLRSVVFDGFQAGTPTAEIGIQSSDFDPANTATSGGGQISPGPGNINADPLFVDSAGGDFSLAEDSPAVDRGNDGFAPSGPDLAGAQRVVDGDQDGEAVVDMGALEFSRATAISSLSAVAVPAVADPGEPVAFIADASDSGDAPLTYAWSFDDGRSGDGEVEIRSFQDPGTHTGTVTVRNPSGAQSSATAGVRIRASETPPGSEPPPDPETPPGAETPPEPETPIQHCAGRDATDVGSSGNDVIRGTGGRDVIVALGGDDKVFGEKGRDFVCGGEGNDRLAGGPGRDRLIGGPGKDRRFP